MANRYWVGGTNTWDATAGTKWATTSGGAGGAAAPTAADDVFFDAASGVVTITLSNAGSCRSLDCTGFTGTFTHNAATALNIGDASGGKLTFVAGMTYNAPSTNGINFVSTSDNGGAGWPITTAGKSLPSITFNGAGGKWVFQDSKTVSAGAATITLTAGTLDTNGQSVTAGVFSSSNSNIRTLTLGSSTITLTTAAGWVTSLNTNLTVTANTATVTMNASGATFNAGSQNWNGMSLAMTGSAIATVNNSHTLANFTRTGTANKTDILNMGSITIIVTNTFTLTSNSNVNRLLVQSSVPAVARTISAANVVISNTVDFMDITGAGAATWTVAGTGATALGDCGGNSGITFTAPATQTHTASAGGNWSDATKWTSRVPLPQDNVIVDSNTTGTLTADMPRWGASIDFTGFAGALTHAVANTLFGSFAYSTGMTISNGATYVFAGRSTHTVTSAGKAFASSVTFQGPGGTYTLQDAFSTGVNSLTVNDGTWTTNNQTVTCGTFSAVSTRTTVVNLGSSNFSLTSTAAVAVFLVNATLTTFNGGTAVISLINASSNARTIGCGNRTLPTITYTVSNSPGALILSNSAPVTIGTLNVGSGRNVVFTSSNTANVTNWNVTGTGNGYLYLPGIASHYISTPDVVNFTGDIECVASVSNWDGVSSLALIGQYTGTASTSSFLFWLDQATSKLRFYHSDGTTIRNTGTNGPVVTITGATRTYLKTTWRQSDARVQFFTSPDGTNWTQAGGDVTLTGTAGIARANVSTEIEIGSYDASGNPGTGGLAAIKLYNAQISNGIGGTLVLDADFTTHNVGSANWSNSAKTQFTESSANAATVSINGSLAQVGDGRVALTSSTPGSAATVSSSGNQTSDYLTIQDSTAQGANWYAGLHSVDNGNNKGWIFGTLTPPSIKGNFTLFGGPN